MRTYRRYFENLSITAFFLLVSLTSTITGCGAPLGTGAPPRTPAALEIAPPTALEVADSESDARTLESKVTKVTVYSDRARITRSAKGEISTAPMVFAFRQLPGWVDDGSVRVSVSAGTIVDVRVDRDFLAKTTDESWQEAESTHRALGNKLAALNDELQILDAKKQQIEAIKAFSNEKITQDTIIGNINVENYGQMLKFVTDSLRETAAARRAVKSKIDELNPAYDASKRRLDSMKNVMKLEQTTVLVTLQATKATPADIELTYMLPGVTWEPMHELRVSTSDTESVDVTSFAEVTQISGEDWGNAELTFSTQSTTQSVRIPELEALTLGDTNTATEILTTQMSSFSRAQEAFEGQNKLWNEYHQSTTARRAMENFEQVYQSNIEYLQIVQSKTVQLFERLQNRGTTVHFRASGASSVRGDGHPVRVQIGRSTLASSQKIVAAPEQSLNAAHTLALMNSTGQPILPGRVALYRDGAFLGMTNVNFIAKGESFSLFLSVADHLKLSRELDQRQSSLLRGKRNRMKVAFVVTVENLSSEKTALTLADRIPVSENREIKIEEVRITPAVKASSKGILNWELNLQSKEKQQFRISYQIEYPATLILETDREGGSMERRSARPASPMEMDAESGIEDQIMQLEENF
jgi:uncharacterized protein (TIGR02231 family)